MMMRMTMMMMMMKKMEIFFFPNNNELVFNITELLISSFSIACVLVPYAFNLVTFKLWSNF